MTLHAVIENDTDGLIRRWDHGAEELFGHPATVALGRPVDFIIPEHLREATGPDFNAR